MHSQFVAVGHWISFLYVILHWNGHYNKKKNVMVLLCNLFNYYNKNEMGKYPHMNL